MAAPVTGEFNLTLAQSDHHVPQNDSKIPNSSGDNLNLIQLAKTSNSQPHVPYAPSKSKRRKSKPKRFQIPQTDLQKENPPPVINLVPNNSSSTCLSLVKVKSPVKVFKTPLPSSPAMLRAQEVQSRLGNEFPCCLKMMVKSQVTCGFWLGLPLHFCKSSLPKEDATVVLEDENGEQFEVKYIAYKFGLSAGWKKFALRHKLTEGDVLVFQLVETTKFKVYILKANDSSEVDGALSLLNLEAHAEEMTPVTPSPRPKKNKHQEPVTLTLIPKRYKRSTPSQLGIPLVEHSGNNSEEVGSEVLEGSRPSKLNHSFEEVKTLEDFHIVVKGRCIDRELPDDVRTGYYELCLFKKQFLHDGLPENLYYKLVAGMIGEIVSIANEIKNCQLTTSKEEFENWDNSLKSFELLGMKVEFLRDRIHEVAKLVFESEGAKHIKRYVDAKNAQELVEDEMMKVAAKFKELKETAKKLKVITSSLKHEAEKYVNEFKQEVKAPWR